MCAWLRSEKTLESFDYKFRPSLDPSLRVTLAEAFEANRADAHSAASEHLV